MMRTVSASVFCRSMTRNTRDPLKGSLFTSLIYELAMNVVLSNSDHRSQARLSRILSSSIERHVMKRPCMSHWRC